MLWWYGLVLQRGGNAQRVTRDVMAVTSAWLSPCFVTASTTVASAPTKTSAVLLKLKGQVLDISWIQA